MAGQRIFNPRHRWLLRSRIGRGEVAASVAVLAVLALALLWVAAQRDAYDPARRDLDPALLVGSKAPEIYQRPLQPWRKPGTGGTGAAPDLGVFPAAVLEGGWRAARSPRTFHPDTLYEKVNGEADKFLRQGFRALHYVVLAGPDDAELSAELFDQGGFAGALGVFSDHATGDRVVQQHGRSRYLLTAGGAIGMHGRWFYRLAGNAATPALRAKAEQVALALDALPVAAGDMPYAWGVLRAAGAEEAGISYQAENVFQYGFARDFWFGALPQAGGDDGPPPRLFVHRAAAPGEAEALAGRILAEHAYDYTTEGQAGPEADDATLLRHRFLGTFFALARSGAVLYGVEEAPDPAAAGGALQRLQGALEAEPSSGR